MITKHYMYKKITYCIGDRFFFTLMVSKQPCSSARTVTMSSIQPDKKKLTALMQLKSRELSFAFNHSKLFTHPKSK